MELRQWLADEGISAYAFGRRLGLKGKQSIYRILRGEREPDAALKDRILALTGGEVTPNDMHATRMRWLAFRRASREETDGGGEPAAMCGG